ncbi:MAG: MFS transporter, partial [Micromonosporaceae bacterium]
VLLVVFLRPDPLLLARRLQVTASGVSGGSRTMRGALAEVRRNRTALLGISAVATGHAMMLAVMVMTPIHIDTVLSATHHHHASGGPDVLVVVGVVISLHVAGMYALSPVVGYASDRYGRRAVVLTGAVLLAAACVLAGTSGADTVRLSAGLFLLGLGWSCTMVAGSTLLSESVPTGVRPSVQGFSDLTMGLSGALAGALSGAVVEWTSYPTLALAAGLIAVPLAVVAAVRPRRVGQRPAAGG